MKFSIIMRLIGITVLFSVYQRGELTGQVINTPVPSIEASGLPPKQISECNTIKPIKIDAKYFFGFTRKLTGADFTTESDIRVTSTPAISTYETPPPPAPNGYINYPLWAPGGWQVTAKKDCNYWVRIKAYGLSDSMSDADKSRIRMVKYNNGIAYDITTGFEKNFVTGMTYFDTSQIALIAPWDLFDTQGPVTHLSYESNNDYANTSTSLELSAIDVSSNANAIAGTATTYYLIDILPTPECLKTTYDQSSPSGTCANSVYTEPFTLIEGSHTVYALSVDMLGNYGEKVSWPLLVDGTPPEINFEVNGGLLPDGETAYIKATDKITLKSRDLFSKGVASGLATTYMLIDINPDECQHFEGLGGEEGAGSCAAPLYTGPFTLSKGEHVIYYYAEDRAGNWTAVKSVKITVK